MIKIGSNSIKFNDVYIRSSAVATGPLEKEGPLGEYFDYSFDNIHCDEKTWEQAEMRLVKEAANIALIKAKTDYNQLDYIIGGDLNNQIAVSTYSFNNTFVPFIGVFAACSTLTLGLGLASILIEGKLASNVLVSTSSHNATSERQFRYPTEYGGQKPESMTFTATASGSAIISNSPSIVKVTEYTTGRIIDVNQKDAQDMGRTMAPAAVITLLDHLHNFNTTIDDYDLIVTGDLSTYGSEIFVKCLEEKNIFIREKHKDAGKELYDIDKQNVYAGGSGCGCVTAFTLGYLVNKIKEGKLNKVLVLATGALLNPVMTAQKLTIPCISHAICLERSTNDLS